jgi:hypothetical protein
MEHHAFVFTADSIEDAPIESTYKVQSADVRHYVQDSFGINDARTLSVEASTKPLQGEHKVFVIAVRTIAIDAQNALLKLFEEPPSHARFYLILPASLPLLPTLRSRLAFQTQTPMSMEDDGVFEEFARATYADRIACIADKVKTKDVAWMETVVRGCEAAAHADRTMLEATLFVRTYMPYKGSSMKMLLEHLALTLPRSGSL